MREVLANDEGLQSSHGTEIGPELSTAQSSPLSSPPPSDLENSRSPPPGLFRFQGLGAAAAVDTLPDQSEEVQDLDVDTEISLPTDLTSDFAYRRNLRARNEKQLHPYMFDKAQYQQQCRERGLRPVRLAETQERGEETQRAPLSDVEDESAPNSQPWSSSPARPSSELGNETLAERGAQKDSTKVQHEDSDTEGDLPELEVLLRQRRSGGFPNASRGRRNFNPARPARSGSDGQSNTVKQHQDDDFSIPPSPPATSSDTSSRPGPVGFKMPRGLSPARLPTPQISSEVRIGVSGDSHDLSDVEPQLRKLRPSTESRVPAETSQVDSSVESSEDDNSQTLDQRRLQREAKRIKHVLPASWLKIDFRAKQNQARISPSRRRSRNSPSPSRTLAQKGVAQRVTPRWNSQDRQDVITISDEDSEIEGSLHSPTPPRVRQLKLHLDRAREMTAPSDFIDDQQMEVDWVDPMFEGSSRKRPKKSAHSKRQPKITEAYRTAGGPRPDFSKERNVMRRTLGATSSRSKPPKKNTRNRTPKRPTAPRLSIMDALDEKASEHPKTPQFVRLAMRNARAQADHGRHSPSHKLIRLATEDDTQDAMVVLRAWREGTIAPREMLSTINQDVMDVAMDDDENKQELIRYDLPRTPLQEIQHNRLHRPSHALQVARPPRMRQIKLHPLKLPRHVPSEQRATRREELDPASSDEAQRRRSFRVYTSTVRYRGAQLESLETDFHRDHWAAAFERRMRLLTEGVGRTKARTENTDLHLARWLNSAQEPVSEHSGPSIQATTHGRQSNADQIESRRRELPHKPRKHRPQRIDVEARRYRQPSEPLPDVCDVETIPEEPRPEAGGILHGLGPFGTKYATDFDIVPLSLGTYFHESSFIGSGDFAASLDFAQRDLDVPTGRIRIHVDGNILEWGAWTEDVASGLSLIPGAVSAALQSLHVDGGTQHDHEAVDVVLSNVEYFLRSTVRYFTRCLAFLDPVDRRQCIQGLQRFVDDLLELIAEHQVGLSFADQVLARCLQYALVLARQASNLSNDPLVQSDVKTRSRELVMRAANRLAGHTIPDCLKELRNFYEDNRLACKRESGIRDSDAAVCSIVILYHISLDLDPAQPTFWSIVYGALNVDAPALNTVHTFDQVWYDTFTIQPALELHNWGILRPGSRLQDAPGNCSLVKQLIDRILELYPSTSFVHGLSINDYVRATFARCCRLISRWGWWRCEPILGSVFDFFARRGLAQLHNEEGRGSPKFLEQLHQQPSFEVQPEDRSFHIFLKMLASGLQGMRKHQVYTDRKIGGIAWRLIPNHGRTYRKDDDVRQEDIDALRNHHDLLCTLYYASPPFHRLRVGLIQNLVDHSTSHREACRLNVRAWANLASYQVSTLEDAASLEPFNIWFQEILKTTVSQYRIARTEVEQDVAHARAQGQPEVPHAIVEDTIIRNQRQVAATLIDALAAMKRVLQCTRNLTTALYLLNGTTFWQVLDLFNPSARRLYGVLNEALEVFRTALDIHRKFDSSAESQTTDEDSQDYGDSGALQEFASTQNPRQSTDQTIADVLHGPLGHLVSNVFGADETTDDSLLTKLIDVWAELAHVMVRAGKKTWTNYITDYGADAWNQLRDTEQKRKTTPYLLSLVVEFGNVGLTETGILNLWLKSLVEREATLKYQHTLTNALLNHYAGEGLLSNLPFSRHGANQYNISLHELRQRRLALLSSVLSNIHDDFNAAAYDRPRTLQQLRTTYSDMLRRLMQAMKSNYQEIQTSHNAEVADVQAQGAYVEFVQQVVSFLQQYTTDVCQVDRFFTDSSAFPIPATDPGYVVGRLKSYVPKLAERRKRKELAVLVQTVSERAAVDGQQPYLVEQLVTAMAGILERGNPQTPSLRTVLCTAIFPAYIENALATPCSWIVAIPVLEASGKTADKLLYNVKLEDHASVRAIVATIDALLQSMAQPIERTLTQAGQLSLPHVKRTLTAVFRAAQQSLSCIRHLQRSGQSAHVVVEKIAQFTQYATTIADHLCDADTFHAVKLPRCQSDVPGIFPDTKEFARKQVQDKLKSDWFAQNGQYYVMRGRNTVEVVADLGNEEEERASLLEALTGFRESYRMMFERGAIAPRTLQGGDGASDVII